MTLPSPESLNNLSREELLTLVVQLIREVQRLQAEVQHLKKPPTTSHNSSQPPSRDQKRNLPLERTARLRVSELVSQERLQEIVGAIARREEAVRLAVAVFDGITHSCDHSFAAGSGCLYRGQKSKTTGLR